MLNKPRNSLKNIQRKAVAKARQTASSSEVFYQMIHFIFEAI